MASSNGFTVLPTTGHSGTTVISITADSLTSMQERGVWVNITAGTLTKSVLAFQDNQQHYLTVSPQRINIPSSGGTTSFTISSDLAWSFVNPTSWAVFSTTSGNGTTTVTVTAPANTSVDNRSANFTVTASGLTALFTVIQPYPATFNISPTSITTTSGASSSYVTITSNSNWTITSIPNWVTASSTAGTGNNTVVFDISAFTSAGTRSGIVVFMCGGQTYRVDITQSGTSYFIVYPNPVELPYSSGAKNLTVSADCEWNVTTLPSIVRMSQTAGTGNALITLTYSENEKVYDVSDTIVFTYNTGNTTSVTITQAANPGAVPFVTLDPHLIYFTGAGSSSMTVNSSTKWYIVTPSGVICSPTAGTGNSVVTVSATSEQAIYDCAVYEQGTNRIMDSFRVVQEGSGSKFVTVGNWTNIPGSGATGSVSLSTFDELEWTLRTDVDWATISPISGTGSTTISVTASTNPTVSVRGGRIIANYLGQGESYGQLQQSAGTAYINVTPSSVYFTNTGGSITLTVDSNVSWTNRFLYTDKFNVDVSSSNSGITLVTLSTKSENLDYSDITEYLRFEYNGSYMNQVEITQQSAPYIKIEPVARGIQTAGGTFDVVVDSTRDFTLSSVSWIDIDTVSGHSGRTTVGVTIGVNPSTTERIGAITATTTAGSATCTITQGYDLYFTISPTALTYTTGGGVSYIQVQSNTYWYLDSYPSWLTPSTTAGTGSQSVGFTALPTYSTARDGIITFKWGEYEQEVTATTYQVMKNEPGTWFDVKHYNYAGEQYLAKNIPANTRVSIDGYQSFITAGTLSYPMEIDETIWVRYYTNPFASGFTPDSVYELPVVSEIFMSTAVTTVGERAFSNNLTYDVVITLSPYITTIGDGAFDGLREDANVKTNDTNYYIYLPNIVTIGASAFRGNSFYDVTNPHRVVLGNNIQSIGNQAFAYIPITGNLTISGPVTSIGMGAFVNCGRGGWLTINSTVPCSVGASAFNSYGYAGWTGLTGSNFDSIGDYAFAYNSGITNSLSITATSIGNYAFAGILMPSIDIHNVSTIGHTVITQVGEVYTHPLSAISITTTASTLTIDGLLGGGGGSHYYLDYSNLKTIYLSGNTIDCKLRSDYGYDDYVTSFSGLISASIIANTYISHAGSGIEDSSIKTLYYTPTAVTSGLCTNCRELTSVTLTRASRIDDGGNDYGAFHECVSLSAITLPSQMTYLGTCAFWNCVSLTGINLSNITHLGGMCLGSIGKKDFSTGINANANVGEDWGPFATWGEGEMGSAESIVIPSGVRGTVDLNGLTDLHTIRSYIMNDDNTYQTDRFTAQNGIFYYPSGGSCAKAQAALPTWTFIQY